MWVCGHDRDNHARWSGLATSSYFLRPKPCLDVRRRGMLQAHARQVSCCSSLEQGSTHIFNRGKCVYFFRNTFQPFRTCPLASASSCLAHSVITAAQSLCLVELAIRQIKRVASPFSTATPYIERSTFSHSILRGASTALSRQSLHHCLSIAYQSSVFLSSIDLISSF